MTLLPVLVLNGTEHNKGKRQNNRSYAVYLNTPSIGVTAGLWASDIIGGLVWATGLLVEAVADQQKFNFKQNPDNKGKFINTGITPLDESFANKTSVWPLRPTVFSPNP